ncbi:hypothetical protein Back11_50510 [Paenibacillus baekrokdamisoli]|uniref:Uncharacterized protein n=1 Tax=Paenibacillus baekrokdamisoli TaxID=1712516 RepID=A0A3G9IYS0_9BACL|nr:hypothetical protein [Paenibacillus baekrokdamisoli]BBH23706.1 hypothetical protein Back11_50510 [Paenibacillus baekrokdamisoli]
MREALPGFSIIKGFPRLVFIKPGLWVTCILEWFSAWLLRLEGQVSLHF